MTRPETLRIRKSDALSDPFIAAGDRAYLIGAQHGGFPPIGWHSPGDMGGLWAHPIKLLDGFWLQIDGRWLPPAHSFISEPFSSVHEYLLADGALVTRRQFVPDGEPALVVRYTFRSPAPRRLALRLLARTDLQSVWSRDAGMASGKDRAAYSSAMDAWVCHDDRHPSWCAVVGARDHRPTGWEQGDHLQGPEPAHGTGISVALDFSLDLTAGHESSLDLIVCGSDRGQDHASTIFRSVRRRTSILWDSKEARFDRLLSQSVASFPDASIQRAWDWVKCAYDWLVRAVPNVGQGLGAGVEEYPWWFGCDASYALLGALALGQHELAVDTMDLLRTLSTRPPGESEHMIHEATTRGEVIGKGSAQETPHAVIAVWETFCWTGDWNFLARNYEFCKRGLLAWTLGERCPDRDLLPCGYGITEREGMDLQCLDAATYTVRALTVLAAMAGTLGDDATAAQCRALAAAARARLDDAFWMEEEGLYGDMVATPAEMIPRLRRWLSEREGLYYRSGQSEAAELIQLLREAESDPHPHQKRPWLLKFWIVICPLEAQLAPPERAERTLNRVEGPEFNGPHGMYLSGIDRTHAMSINTGALAVAEIAYGRVDQGLRSVRMLTDSLDLHMPGAISEMSPDYGCFVQAWSGYAVAWPLAAHVFGLRPDAYHKRLEVNARFPAGWTDASLDNVRVGDSVFDFRWDGTDLLVTAHDPGWTITSSTVPLHTRELEGRSA